MWIRCRGIFEGDWSCLSYYRRFDLGMLRFFVFLLICEWGKLEFIGIVSTQGEWRVCK